MRHHVLIRALVVGTLAASFVLAMALLGSGWLRDGIERTTALVLLSVAGLGALGALLRGAREDRVEARQLEVVRELTLELRRSE